MIDNEKTRKTPVLRFKGFTDDWEQRKFSEIAQRESAAKKSSTDFPSVEYEDVVSEVGILNKDVRLKETQKTGIGFDGSQVLYGKLRPYLHNWLSPDFSGVAVGDWWVLKPVNVDKSFLFRLIQTEKFDDIANQSSGSKMPRADWNLLSNTEFMVPAEIEEERKIGQYFSELDHLITLHQKKVFSLTIVKKSMLEKMFPKAGSKVPEIRFYGFTGDWEQRKLGEITEISSGQNVPNEDGGKYYNLTMGSVNTEGHLVCSLHTNRSDRLLVKGTLIMPTRDVGAGYVIGRTAVIDENDKYYAGNCLYCLSTGLNEPYYIHHYMNSEMARKSMQIIVAGGSQKQITLPGIKSIEVPICSIEEQRKIAQLFNDLDKTITLHQKELDKLLALKKSMLSEMFPK